MGAFGAIDEEVEDRKARWRKIHEAATLKQLGYVIGRTFQTTILLAISATILGCM